MSISCKIMFVFVIMICCIPIFFFFRLIFSMFLQSVLELNINQILAMNTQHLDPSHSQTLMLNGIITLLSQIGKLLLIKMLVIVKEVFSAQILLNLLGNHLVLQIKQSNIKNKVMHFMGIEYQHQLKFFKNYILNHNFESAENVR